MKLLFDDLVLSLATHHGFEALVTGDRGIEYQQSANRRPIPIVMMVAVRNRPAELQPLLPKW